jgi:hypothetical protein
MLKNRSSRLTAWIAVLFTAAAAPAMAQNYHAVCRGGAEAAIHAHTFNLFGGVKLRYTFEKYRGTKASVKTDGSHLGPGECSWSTNVMAAALKFPIRAETTMDKLGFYLDVAGSTRASDENHRATASLFRYDEYDTDLAMLPTSMVDNQGTIYDPDAVFHLYLYIENNQLFLAYVRP